MTTTTSTTSQAVAEWCAVFPRQAGETAAGSLAFMRRLALVALSTVAYLRAALPEDSFARAALGALRPRELRPDAPHPLARFLAAALERAFHALDRRYLQQMVLCFHAAESPRELECHALEFSYGGPGGAGVRGGGPRGAVARLATLRRDTELLLRACAAQLAEAPPLPDEYFVSVRLYYNDAAPAEYQAPGYAAWRGAARAGALRLGAVRTPHHALALRYSGASATQNALTDPEASSDESESAESAGRAGRARAAVKCACGLPDDEPPLLTCRFCGWSQHAACYGRRAGGAHCCAACSAHHPREPRPDPRLQRRGSTSVAVYRRALQWARQGAAAAASGAALGARLRLSAASAARLLAVLRAQGLLRPTPGAPDSLDSPLCFDLARVEAALDEHCPPAPAPAPASPAPAPASPAPADPAPDPAPPHCEPHVPPAAPAPPTDETLRQYRAALSPPPPPPPPPPAEELPLSGPHNPVRLPAKRGAGDGPQRAAAAARGKRARAARK